MRITWDESVDGQIMQTADGKAKLNFADRALLISNHQVIGHLQALRLPFNISVIDLY